jgi:hypothetical protein
MIINRFAGDRQSVWVYGRDKSSNSSAIGSSSRPQMDGQTSRRVRPRLRLYLARSGAREGHREVAPCTKPTPAAAAAFLKPKDRLSGP